MRLTYRVAGYFKRRDWVENAAVKVYNALALRRERKVGEGELLVLIPRCLSKETLDGVLGIAGQYGVPVFVATRGQLARRVIRERRPRAVVAVACERDMVSGLHDVAGKIPVLGLTMTLPSGPRKDASRILGQFEAWVRSYVVWPISTPFSHHIMPGLRPGFDNLCGLVAHPALTGRAPNWRGPPDRGCPASYNGSLHSQRAVL